MAHLSRCAGSSLSTWPDRYAYHTARKTALRVGPYSANNHFAAGIYLRENGAARMPAFAVDGNSGYEVKIDSVADTIALLRWDNGVSTSLASAPVTIDPNVHYRLGLSRDGAYLRVFLSADDTAVFRDTNLILYVANGVYLSGRIGLVSCEQTRVISTPGREVQSMPCRRSFPTRPIHAGTLTRRSWPGE